MILNKTLLIAALATTGIVASLATVGIASATSGGGQDDLVSKIAKKFNLKESEVKAVFDDNRTEKQAERQKDFEEKLTQAVKDGKITTDQKNKLIVKHKEMQADREANRGSMKNKTQEESHSTMEAKRSELEQWAKDNNIPTEYLRPGEGRGGHRGEM